MIKISTRAKYGLRAMIDIGVHSARGPVYLKDIAQRQEISMKYLDHIVTILKTRGFVKNGAGGHGGYVLVLPAEELFVNEIVEALEGSLSPSGCADSEKNCKRSGRCVTRRLWQRVKEGIREALSVRLSELVESEKEIFSHG